MDSLLVNPLELHQCSRPLCLLADPLFNLLVNPLGTRHVSLLVNRLVVPRLSPREYRLDNRPLNRRDILQLNQLGSPLVNRLDSQPANLQVNRCLILHQDLLTSPPLIPLISPQLIPLLNRQENPVGFRQDSRLADPLSSLRVSQ